MATKLDLELKQLGSMTRAEFVERWQAAYDCLPPAGTRRELLMYAAGWHIQAKRLAGLSAEAKRKLRREVERLLGECRTGMAQLGGEHDDGEAGKLPNANDALPVFGPPAERRMPGLGTRLLRDWNGRTHAVDVVENGYLYEGNTYRSLSAIARRITGAHWSGPRFFGL